MILMDFKKKVWYFSFLNLVVSLLQFFFISYKLEHFNHSLNVPSKAINEKPRFSNVSCVFFSFFLFFKLNLSNRKSVLP